MAAGFAALADGVLAPLPRHVASRPRQTMQSSSHPAGFRVLSSLRLGDRVTVRSEDGLLFTEYALFDPADIVLRATDPVTVREAGYMTTAHDAMVRLERAGVTPALAEEAALALGPDVVSSFARGAAARGLAARLGPQELFDGGVFNATQQFYSGAWLDLAAMHAQIAVPGASLLLQALHLACALSEVGGATPVHLSTAAVTRERRPGERTHARVPLDTAHRLPEALKMLSARPRPIELDAVDDRRMRRDLLARVRERITPDATPQLRAHLATLEGTLGHRTLQIGPLADPELQAIERRLAGGDARGISSQLDDLERTRGRAPGIRYLRARAALLTGEEPPRSVAELLSELAREDHGFHEAALGAARTWLAAGEDGRARHFAQQLAGNSAAPESERLMAVEILDETTGTAESHWLPVEILREPDSYPETTASPAADQVWPSPGAQSPKPHLFPSLGDLPPPEALPQVPTMAPPPVGNPGRDGGEGDAPPPRRPARDPRRRLVQRYEPELVESLALPLGASEATLGVNDLPRTPLQARIAMTRLARDLARDYRLWYGKSLRCNVLAIDSMQQHLMHRFAGAPISDEGVAWELRRHGAFLSEVIARALGAEWIDITPSEPGYWAMLIPPETRSWPIGRVYRFVALGNRGRDLVGYYLELDTRARENE